MQSHNKDSFVEADWMLEVKKVVYDNIKSRKLEWGLCLWERKKDTRASWYNFIFKWDTDKEFF